ncbi:hypothetical protein AX16_003515 [Volvariella volvacea WC 439]|nr:hypothetical protein AX16_003515 [Volvariella volvacea WC 439]
MGQASTSDSKLQGSLLRTSSAYLPTGGPANAREFSASCLFSTSPYRRYSVNHEPGRSYLSRRHNGLYSPTLAQGDSSNAFVQIAGTAVSSCLYGCLVMQFYTYYTVPATAAKQPKDPVWLRCIVGILCILESGFTLVTAHGVWVYTVEGWGTSSVLQHGRKHWTTATFPAFTELVASIVQIFLALRIWKLSGMSLKGGIMALVIVILALMGGILGIFAATKAFRFLIRSLVITFHLHQAWSYHNQVLAGPQDPTASNHRYLCSPGQTYFILTLVCDIIITINMIILPGERNHPQVLRIRCRDYFGYGYDLGSLSARPKNPTIYSSVALNSQIVYDNSVGIAQWPEALIWQWSRERKHPSCH